MRGKAHLATGFLSGIITAVCTYNGGIVAPIALVTASTIGSIIPDIDLPTSTAGKVVKPISFIINKLFGHRTITHAPIWLIPLAILCYELPVFMSGCSDFWVNVLTYCLYGYITGFTCHLLGDMFTKGGIPLKYPFARKRYHLTNAESGKHDILISMSVILIAGLVWFLTKKYIL